MGESTSFSIKNNSKLENNLLKACLSHSFLLSLHLSRRGWLALRCRLVNESPWLGTILN